jgi:uncharacterized membrane protein
MAALHAKVVGASLTIAALWILFGVTHVVLSSATLRPRLVDRLGAQGFQGVYSVAVIASFVPLVWVFAMHKHAGPLLWTTIGPPSVARGANYALNAIAFALLVCSLMPSSAAPSSLAAPGAKVTPHGIVRITRHPMLAAFGCWGIAHLLVNGSLGDVFFFGGFALWVWLGSRHQDARMARSRPGYAELVATTSLVPFWAILTGRQRLVVGELPWTPIVAGLAMTVALRWWHATLFGP